MAEQMPEYMTFLRATKDADYERYLAMKRGSLFPWPIIADLVMYMLDADFALAFRMPRKQAGQAILGCSCRR